MNRFFDLKTHKLAYRLQETPGTPQILFLHGCGANHSQFEREFAQLADSYSVAALSLRGQGKSTRPSGNKPEDLKIPELAADVISWLKAHHWQQPHVVACSMGGVVALEALRQQKDVFKSLFTFGTTPKLTVSPGMIKVGAWLADVFLPGLFPDWMARTIAKATTDKPEAQQRFIEDLKVAYSQRQTIYQLRCALAHYDYISLLASLSLPVLMLQGEKDRAINREIDKAWPVISQNPLIRRQIMMDAGHIANYDQPQAFLDHVRQFLKEQES